MYWLVIIILTIGFLYKLVLGILDYKSIGNKIPENVSDIYDEEKYKTWLSYKKDGFKLSIINACISYFVLLLLFVFKVFSRVCNLFNTDNPYLTSLIVCVVFFIFDIILTVVFDYIYTFKLEEKYGFNTTTKKTFVIDEIKNALINILLIYGLISLFIVLYNKFDYLVIIVASIIIFLVTFILYLFSEKFTRIFNKLTPLPDGLLRDKLANLLDSNGYKVKDIMVMDGSRRSTKADALFMGLGKWKTIVLYDTIINLLTEDEIVAVFAHELGHGKHKDILTGYIESMFNILVIVFVVWLLTIPSLSGIYTEYGFNQINYGMAFIVLMSVVMPIISPLFGLITNKLSRKKEYAADGFAASLGYGDELISSLKKLAANHLDNLSPNQVVVCLTYSHPTMSQRIDAINKIKNLKEE